MLIITKGYFSIHCDCDTLCFRHFEVAAVDGSGWGWGVGSISLAKSLLGFTLQGLGTIEDFQSLHKITIDQWCADCWNQSEPARLR